MADKRTSSGESKTTQVREIEYDKEGRVVKETTTTTRTDTNMEN